MALSSASLTIFSAMLSYGQIPTDGSFTISQFSSMDDCKSAVKLVVDNELNLDKVWRLTEPQRLLEGEFGMAIKGAGKYREFICRNLN